MYLVSTFEKIKNEKEALNGIWIGRIGPGASEYYSIKYTHDNKLL